VGGCTFNIEGIPTVETTAAQEPDSSGEGRETAAEAGPQSDAITQREISGISTWDADLPKDSGTSLSPVTLDSGVLPRPDAIAPWMPPEPIPGAVVADEDSGVADDDDDDAGAGRGRPPVDGGCEQYGACYALDGSGACVVATLGIWRLDKECPKSGNELCTAPSSKFVHFAPDGSGLQCDTALRDVCCSTSVWHDDCSYDTHRVTMQMVYVSEDHMQLDRPSSTIFLHRVEASIEPDYCGY